MNEVYGDISNSASLCGCLFEVCILMSERRLSPQHRHTLPTQLKRVEGEREDYLTADKQRLPPPPLSQPSADQRRKWRHTNQTESHYPVAGADAAGA